MEKDIHRYATTAATTARAAASATTFAATTTAATATAAAATTTGQVRAGSGVQAPEAAGSASAETTG